MSFTRVGRINPLSVNQAFTTPPAAPEALISVAQYQGFTIKRSDLIARFWNRSSLLRYSTIVHGEK